jgi:hypothetical protein
LQENKTQTNVPRIIDAKVSNSILVNQTQQCIKKIILYDQVVLISGCNTDLPFGNQVM